MSDPIRTGKGKPPPSPGISQEPIHQLKARVERLEHQVAQLVEQLHERNQWSYLQKKWAGQRIVVNQVNQVRLAGDLLWADRYTICIRDGVSREILVHKGAIANVHLEYSPPETEKG